MSEDTIRFRDRELREKIELEATETGKSLTDVARERMRASFGIGLDIVTMKAENEKVIGLELATKNAWTGKVTEAK